MTLVRLALLTVVGLLAGCAGSAVDTARSTRHLQPLSDETKEELAEKGMSPASPILVRIFKKESELEVWKQARNGQYRKFKTYKICKWSGDLGPKIQEGDKQAPEGFYSVTPAQMNPRSKYYLSFNLGFPNAYDQSLGRTGSNLMVHGDCLSAGCYAMTDEQMKEIYALAREAFSGGQTSFQVQAYPFRMTPRNLAKHRGSPNMPFWKNLKKGNDHFMVTRREPRVAVCGKKYVFNPGDGVSNASFSPSRACPSFAVADGLAAAVAAKEKKDQAAIKVAAVQLAEERAAAIEAAKPNAILQGIANAARKEPAAAPAAKAEGATGTGPATGKGEGEATAKSDAAPSSAGSAASAIAPVQKPVEEDPDGTAIGRFLSRIVGGDEKPAPTPRAAPAAPTAAPEGMAKE